METGALVISWPVSEIRLGASCLMQDSGGGSGMDSISRDSVIRTLSKGTGSKHQEAECQPQDDGYANFAWSLHRVGPSFSSKIVCLLKG